MNIAIIGAAYTGLKAASYLKGQGHTISVTTTSPHRVASLEQVADRVIVMNGSDREKMRELIAGHDVVLMTVAGGMVERDGKYVMDLDLYTDAYVGTAKSLVESLAAAPNLKQIVFTGSWRAYGNAGGADIVTEDTPATPADSRRCATSRWNTGFCCAICPCRADLPARRPRCGQSQAQSQAGRRDCSAARARKSAPTARPVLRTVTLDRPADPGRVDAAHPPGLEFARRLEHGEQVEQAPAPHPEQLVPGHVPGFLCL